MAAKATSGDGQSGLSVWLHSVDRGLNSGLLFGDTWSCGLRMVSLKEEGGAQATRWLVAWGRSNDGFSSASGAAVVEVNSEESRVRREKKGGDLQRGVALKVARGGGQWRQKRWAKPRAWARQRPPLSKGAQHDWVPLSGR
jgi:hypothetical protein